MAENITNKHTATAIRTPPAPCGVGVKELNPEGLMCSTGQWAPALATQLAKGHLLCRILDGRKCLAAVLEKKVFICLTNKVRQLQLHDGLTVGEVHSPERNDE